VHGFCDEAGYLFLRYTRGSVTPRAG